MKPKAVSPTKKQAKSVDKSRQRREQADKLPVVALRETTKIEGRPISRTKSCFSSFTPKPEGVSKMLPKKDAEGSPSGLSKGSASRVNAIKRKKVPEGSSSGLSKGGASRVNAITRWKVPERSSSGGGVWIDAIVVRRETGGSASDMAKSSGSHVKAIMPKKDTEGDSSALSKSSGSRSNGSIPKKEAISSAMLKMFGPNATLVEVPEKPVKVPKSSDLTPLESAVLRRRLEWPRSVTLPATPLNKESTAKKQENVEPKTNGDNNTTSGS